MSAYTLHKPVSYFGLLLFVTVSFVSLFVTGPTWADSDKYGAGFLVPSKGGALVRPSSHIKNYFGSLSRVQLDTLLNGIESGALSSSPIEKFDSLAGTEGLFFMVANASGSEELGKILRKEFIYTASPGQRVFISESGLQTIEAAYSGEELASLVKSVAVNQITDTQKENASYTGVVFSMTTKGDTILGDSNKFVPVAGRFSVEGGMSSARVRQVGAGLYVTGDVEKAIISDWTHLKKGDSVVGWVLKLTSGQIVVPVNRALLELILADENSNGIDPVPDASYPVDGRLRVNLTDFNDDGAVLDLSSGYGLYVMEGSDGRGTYVTLADDPQFTIIEAAPTLKRKARQLMEALSESSRSDRQELEEDEGNWWQSIKSFLGFQ